MPEASASKAYKEFLWEVMQLGEVECLERAKIRGGWLVKCEVYSTVRIGDYDEQMTSASITFVPDPQYEWDGSTLE